MNSIALWVDRLRIYRMSFLLAPVRPHHIPNEKMRIWTIYFASLRHRVGEKLDGKCLHENKTPHVMPPLPRTTNSLRNLSHSTYRWRTHVIQCPTVVSPRSRSSLSKTKYEMVHGTFTYINLPLTQAKISHSTADGVAPRFVGASTWWISVDSPHNHPPTTDSIRWEANISKTICTCIHTKFVRYQRKMAWIAFNVAQAKPSRGKQKIKKK